MKKPKTKKFNLNRSVWNIPVLFLSVFLLSLVAILFLVILFQNLDTGCTEILARHGFGKVFCYNKEPVFFIIGVVAGLGWLWIIIRLLWNLFQLLRITVAEFLKKPRTEK